MSQHLRWLVFIFVLAIFCLYVALPAETKGVTPDDPICEEWKRDETTFTGDVRCTENIVLDLQNDNQPEFQLNVTQSLGLDLVGGLRVLLEADLPPDAFSAEDLAETANNVDRRVNALGLTEATIQVQGANRILVELPGVHDREQAISTIQQTALLEFVDFSGITSPQQYVGRHILTTEQVRLQDLRGDEAIDDGIERLPNPGTNGPFETVMTGAGLQAASAQYGALSQTSAASWFINFEIDPDYQQTFGTFTGNNVGQPMAIVLDGVVISAPVIQAQLTSGGVITGDFTEEEATQLALQLRSGALPIPLSVESAEEVGATLGQESVNLSVRAGVIGVVIVLAFMLIYYRVPGIAADLALIVYILLNLALFKLIPVTLTLPAITGLLIGIGTAVDGNILIFERIKEEIRDGKRLDEALDSGFARAWSSIRDSNLSTIIICVVLFFFGQTPGASVVSGFAVTLALGLVVNLFTAVLVTRTFLYVIVGLFHNAVSDRKWLVGA
ncbi:protein translocase subunit SecD [Phototrophicus methaneseepsis]|uniref:Protein translocase subunit SecD n=1 Tax=Phototrophicus methaneseepsis TaxID=2710758 RepID=A0A7S8ICY3_9CHLR|nr:protein translocase subunit SecD [Phototrophicus methaneseepsis]QPC80971.1 protein translocase subunit SecD [Phototrophicus methaneseepsis]